jgi:hypothetical protein
MNWFPDLLGVLAFLGVLWLAYARMKDKKRWIGVVKDARDRAKRFGQDHLSDVLDLFRR